MPESTEAASNRYRVTATTLNLRSHPIVAQRTRLASLPEGHVVEKVAVANDPAWWLVKSLIAGEPVSGFVAHRYLASVAEAESLASHDQIVEVHLKTNHPNATRRSTAARAFPLNEAGQPMRTSTMTATEKFAALAKIISWLRVDQSPRYRPTTGTTFCNIYAYDYCYLAGVYLPRVWWTGQALIDLSRGDSVSARYGITVSELNANSLYAWLEEFGPLFRWQRMLDLDVLQKKVNAGRVGLICAQRADLNRSGHIAAVVPETPSNEALRQNDKVKRPLQSQAGRQNYQYGTGSRKWWTGDQFRAFGFWCHD